MNGDGIGDRFVRKRLETVLGYKVTLGSDTLGAAALVKLAEEADLVLVSESVSSANLQGKLKPVTRPILSYEAFIQDEMGLTAPAPPAIRASRRSSPWGSRPTRAASTSWTPSTLWRQASAAR
jgi:hypothetical protein